MPVSSPSVSDPYPLERIFGRILSPFERFLRNATAGGIVLVAATALTLVVANSTAGPAWERFWQQSLSIAGFGGAIEHTLREWVNDGLMVLFFLLVGLELKREVLVGELASIRDAALPIVGAIGGMVAPAAIYLVINTSPPESRGWGVPMATDIAFAVGIVMMLGDRVPRGVVVFLMALAIVDDLGAVLAIAIGYTHALDVAAIAGAAVVYMILALANRAGVRDPRPYAVLGVVLWYFVLLSGAHAALAGILLAVAIPARPGCAPQRFAERVDQLVTSFRAHAHDPTTPSDPLASHDMATIAGALERDAKAVQSPLHRVERALQPWIAYVVLPIFALANAAITLDRATLVEAFDDSITFGILLGLPLGKFVGIAGGAYLAVRLGWARLPIGVRWPHIVGAAWVGGVGFTMSLFISQLAFDANDAQIAKVGILTGSLVSALIGLAWLAIVARLRNS